MAEGTAFSRLISARLSVSSAASGASCAPFTRSPMQGRCWKRSVRCARCWSSSSASAGSRARSRPQLEALDGRRPRRPRPLAKAGSFSMHRRCTTGPWPRSRPSSALKARRSRLHGRGLPQSSATSGPVTGASATPNSAPPRLASASSTTCSTATSRMRHRTRRCFRSTCYWRSSETGLVLRGEPTAQFVALPRVPARRAPAPRGAQ